MGDDDPAPGPHGGLGGVGGGMGGPGGGPFGGLVWPTGPKNKGFAPLPGLGGGLLEGLVGAPPPPSTPQPKPPTDQSPGALAAIASQMGMQSSAGPGSSLMMAAGKLDNDDSVDSEESFEAPGSGGPEYS